MELLNALKKRVENETINKALDLLYEQEMRRDKYAREILDEVKRILSK